MKTIKIRSGGEAYILEPDEVCPPGAVCFMTAEWHYAQRLARDCQKDPEAHRSFWETLLQKKREIPGYVIYADFPINDDNAKAKFPGHTICSEIISMLRGQTKNVEEDGQQIPQQKNNQ